MASRKKAIDMKCRECIYDKLAGDGTWRQQVEACQFKECPLYPYRPLSKGERYRDIATLSIADAVSNG